MQPKWGQVRLTEVNPYLVCVLCRGYFIDATTIVECLHSFCRSCIIKYLENNTFCPICDVQIHKAKPFRNIKPDKTLQNIVYKLVPSLYHKEMVRRRAFYAKHPAYAARTTPEDRGEGLERMIYAPAENISLSLEYYDVEREREEWESVSVSSHNSDIVEAFWIKKRYLLCPALVTVGVLKKFLRNKYDLTSRHRVEILHKRESLSDDLKLMDVAYIYTWKQKGPIQFQYRFSNATTTAEAVLDLKNEKDKKLVEISCRRAPSPDISTLSPAPSPSSHPAMSDSVPSLLLNPSPKPAAISDHVPNFATVSSSVPSPDSVSSPTPDPTIFPNHVSDRVPNPDTIPAAISSPVLGPGIASDLAVTSIPVPSPTPALDIVSISNPLPSCSLSPEPAAISNHTATSSLIPSSDVSPSLIPASKPATISSPAHTPAPIPISIPKTVSDSAASPSITPNPTTPPMPVSESAATPSPASNVATIPSPAPNCPATPSPDVNCAPMPTPLPNPSTLHSSVSNSTAPLSSTPNRVTVPSPVPKSDIPSTTSNCVNLSISASVTSPSPTPIPAIVTASMPADVSTLSLTSAPSPVSIAAPKPAAIPSPVASPARSPIAIPSPAHNPAASPSPAASSSPRSALYVEPVSSQPLTSVETATPSTSSDTNSNIKISSSMQSPLLPTHVKRVKHAGVKKSKGEPNLLGASSSGSGNDFKSTPGKPPKPVVPSKRTASQITQGATSRISISLLASLALERRQQSVPIVSAARKHASLDSKGEEKRPRLTAKLAPPLPALTSITSSSVSKANAHRDFVGIASSSSANKSSADGISSMSKLTVNKGLSPTANTSSRLLGSKSSSATSTSSKLLGNKSSTSTSTSSKLVANKSLVDTEMHVTKNPSQSASAVNSITKKSSGHCVPDTLTITPIVIPKKEHKGSEQKAGVEVPVKVSLTVEEVTRPGAYTHTEANSGRMQRQASSIPRLVELTKSVAKKPRLTVRRVGKQTDSQKVDCISALDLSSSSQHPRSHSANILNIAQNLARRQQQHLTTSSLGQSTAPPPTPNPALSISTLSSMPPFPVTTIMSARSPPPSLRIPVPPTSSANFRVQGPSHQRSSLLPAPPSPAEGSPGHLRNPRVPGACTPPHNLFQSQTHLLPPPPRSFMFRSRYDMQNPWHGEWYNEQLLQCLGRLRRGDSMPPTPYFSTKTGASNSRK